MLGSASGVGDGGDLKILYLIDQAVDVVHTAAAVAVVVVGMEQPMDIFLEGYCMLQQNGCSHSQGACKPFHPEHFPYYD